MRYRLPFAILGVSSLLVLPLPTHAQQARVSADQLPPASVVTETGQELAAQGCQQQTFTNETRSFLVNPEAPYPVIAADVEQGGGQTEIFFCSRETVDALTVQGRLSQDPPADPGAKGASECGVLSWWACIVEGVYYLVNWVLTLLAEVANAILTLVAMGATYFLGYGTFLTNPLVRVGWPFVLGFANLGFVLGLLFIALATVLRIEGFQARRMLPKLLIAALLINFSLIIAVFILDLSRLTMAVMAQSIASNDGCADKPVNCLAANILKKSAVVNEGFTIGKTSEGGWASVDMKGKASPRQGVMALLVIVLMALAFGTLFVVLLIRWLALIILLVLSPLAYLFVALPGTANLARQWWQQFIKYVIYGPAIVFVLAIFAQAQDPVYTALKDSVGGLPVLGDVVASSLMAGITAAALFGAAGLGQQLGMVGGAAATRGGLKAARGIGKVAYVGTGARRGLRRAGEAVAYAPGVMGVRSYMRRVAASEKERKRIKDQRFGLVEEEGAKDAQRWKGLLGERFGLWKLGIGKKPGREAGVEFEEKYRRRYMGMYDSDTKKDYKLRQRDNAVSAVETALQLPGGLENLVEAKREQHMAGLSSSDTNRIFTDLANRGALSPDVVQRAQTDGEKKKAIGDHIQHSLRAENMREEEVVYALEHTNLYKDNVTGELTLNERDANGNDNQKDDMVGALFQYHNSGKALRALMANKAFMHRIGTVRRRDALGPRLRQNKNIPVDDLAEVPPEAYAYLTKLKAEAAAKLAAAQQRLGPRPAVGTGAQAAYDAALAAAQQQHDETIKQLESERLEFIRDVTQHQYVKGEDNLDILLSEAGKVIRDFDEKK